MVILAADSWKTNAELVQACHMLGYLKDEDVVLDATYGKGVWWNIWRPPRLVAHKGDFLDLNHPDGFFDAATFDPPYVSLGGRDTSTMDEFNERYGLKETPKTPLLLQNLINDGLSVVSAKVRPKGIILVKCMDYISSGKLFPGTHYTLTFAMNHLNLELVDRFEHVGRPRAQPKGRRQVHARRNLSTLFVLRRPKWRT
jgi:hypothetical protein